MMLQAIFFDMGGTIETLTFDDDMRLAATYKIHQWLVEQGLDPGLPPPDLYQVIRVLAFSPASWSVAAVEATHALLPT
jgi:hypothetical protein